MHEEAQLPMQLQQNRTNRTNSRNDPTPPTNHWPGQKPVVRGLHGRPLGGPWPAGNAISARVVTLLQSRRNGVRTATDKLQVTRRLVSPGNTSLG